MLFIGFGPAALPQVESVCYRAFLYCRSIDILVEMGLHRRVPRRLEQFAAVHGGALDARLGLGHLPVLVDYDPHDHDSGFLHVVAWLGQHSDGGPALYPGIRFAVFCAAALSSGSAASGVPPTMVS